MIQVGSGPSRTSREEERLDERDLRHNGHDLRGVLVAGAAGGGRGARRDLRQREPAQELDGARLRRLAGDRRGRGRGHREVRLRGDASRGLGQEGRDARRAPRGSGGARCRREAQPARDIRGLRRPAVLRGDGADARLAATGAARRGRQPRGPGTHPAAALRADPLREPALLRHRLQDALASRSQHGLADRVGLGGLGRVERGPALPHGVGGGLRRRRGAARRGAQPLLRLCRHDSRPHHAGQVLRGTRQGAHHGRHRRPHGPYAQDRHGRARRPRSRCRPRTWPWGIA